LESEPTTRRNRQAKRQNFLRTVLDRTIRFDPKAMALLAQLLEQRVSS